MGKSNGRGSNNFCRSGSRRGSSPPTTTNPEGVWFLLASTHAWIGASDARGQVAAAEGLVRFQLPVNSPNRPFVSVLPNVGCVGVARACPSPLHPGLCSTSSYRPLFEDVPGGVRKPMYLRLTGG